MSKPSGMKKGVIAGIIVVGVLAVGYLAYAYLTESGPFAPAEPMASESPSPLVSASPAASPTMTPLDLNSIFELNKKKAGTKIFYSENLGVGLTYDPTPSTIYSVTATQVGSKIYVQEAMNNQPAGPGGQSIEVFTKDPAMTLEQGIQAKFLTGYNPKDCFVKVYPTNEQGLSNYVSAGISYPAPTDPDAPFFQNAERCPLGYSETNGLAYFLMNKEAPGTFVYVWVGQDSFTSDGTPPTANGGFNWSHSIRILK